MVQVVIDPNILYFPQYGEELLQSALWYDKLLLPQWHSFFLTTGRLSLSYEKGTLLGDLREHSILDVIPDPLQDVLPIQEVMSKLIKRTDFRFFQDLTTIIQRRIKKQGVLPGLSPTWREDLLRGILPRGIFCIPMLETEEEAIEFFDWFNDATGLSQLGEFLGIAESSLELESGRAMRQPYYLYRDVSSVVTILAKDLPVLSRPNPHYDNFPTLLTHVEDVLKNCQIFQRSPTVEKHEVARDLIVPRICLRDIDDVIKWRRDSAFVDLRKVIDEITSKSRDDLCDPLFYKDIVEELNSRYEEEFSKELSITKRTFLKAVGLWTTNFLLTTLTGLPLPVSLVVSILEKWRKKMEREKKWYTLLWSFYRKV